MRLRRKYTQQKSNAKRRRIGFRLTFEQWLSIWQTSGQIRKMGRHSKQYCMARLGDQGAYEVGNVHIVTCHQNKMELSATVRRRMSAKAKLRIARMSATELKRKMKAVQTARDPVERRKTSSRVGKKVWATMSAAEQISKMTKMRDARWRRI